MNDFEPRRSGDNNQPRMNEESIQTSKPDVVSKSATGPRTRDGKQRSKMNSVKHGIFAAGILRGFERKADHEKLVEELRNCFQPQNVIDELRVEKLAMLFRRQRRLLISESAEILNQLSDCKLQKEALEQEDRVNSKKSERGLMEFLANPFVVERCIQLLTDWRERLCQRGYDSYFDLPLMRKLYGRCPGEELDVRTQQGITEAFAKSERKKPDVWSEKDTNEFQGKQCKELMAKLDGEIEYLKHVKSVSDSMTAELTENERNSQLVPRAENLDRFIRYEAYIFREIDRTVAQLKCARAAE
jgi:hypothetical protein